MAVLAANATMDFREDEKTIHPFFGRRANAHQSLATSDSMPFFMHTPIKQSALESSEGGCSVQYGNEKGGKASTTYDSSSICGTSRVDDGAREQQDPELLDVDPNHDRRKRRKSASPQAEPSQQSFLGSIGQDGIKANIGGPNLKTDSENNDNHANQTLGVEEPCPINASRALASTHMSGEVLIPINSREQVSGSDTLDAEINTSRLDVVYHSKDMVPHLEFATTIAATAEGLTTTKPQKVLRLNPRTGTIGSPPTKTTTRTSNGTGHKAGSRKSPKRPRSLLITMKYGGNSDARLSMGSKIDQILYGTRLALLSTEASRGSPNPVETLGSHKSTHPFFLGKGAVKTTPLSAPRSVIVDEATEGKSRHRTTSMTLGEAKSHSPVYKRDRADVTAFQTLGNANKILRFPGAAEPCWPPHGMVHVKDDMNPKSLSHVRPELADLFTEKKSKYTTTETSAKDDVLKVMGAKLCIDQVLESLQNIDLDSFAEPERCLRVPEKHFEVGPQIQRRIRHELSMRLPMITAPEGPTSSEDELLGDGKTGDAINTALLKVYNAIPNSLTAFDRSQYETQSWINKYAPCSAADVLQSGREAFILKGWLQALMVVSVDTGTRDSSQSRSVSAVSRKRKSNKLDGFVISSDEDDDDMDEISDPEDFSPVPDATRRTKRTVVSSGDVIGRRSRDSRKVKNAIVISGPSGCGKTAMVYGVAKELGFEIFEINSSSRRSGKEILERVGDMTRNHLVHPSQHSGTPDPQVEDNQRISDALAADIKSGRQGTMNSFFKPKKVDNGKVDVNSLADRNKKEAEVSLLKPPKATPKAQKQSLILLEEVDILFEEDKQFWSTVLTLIAQSKRPIIMTCNDEALLPLQTLTLHAIIRLSPPPANVAVDYMLLVAAAEGHIIKRKAVKALYEARQHDLRASMTELDYWCQLGVGDRKGGLDWCYPRWPPGSDVDNHGNTIRVVSEGTYRTGMGWLGRDFFFERLESEVKEELLHEAWDGWNIDFNDLHDMQDLSSSLSHTKDLAALSSYEDRMDAISLADICACGSLATGNQALIDTCSPPVSANVRDDYVIGYGLLQTDTPAPSDTLGKEISLWMSYQAQELLPNDIHLRTGLSSEAQISAQIAHLGCKQDDTIRRQDFGLAFDPLAESEKNTIQTTSTLEPSVLDRTTSIIAIDVAPFVRSIVAYDAKLQQQRVRLSNLLSKGGREGKRFRTTRSALSALEGGTRKTTRPEKYFKVSLNPHLVRRTGLQSWHDAIASEGEIAKIDLRERNAGRESYEGSSPGNSDIS